MERDDRIRWFARGAEWGLDHYIYAPKDDPWHRDRWREPYPADRLAALVALDVAASRAGVRFVYAIAPGLSMRFDDPAEHELLAAKCGQLLKAGIGSFALLFDDVPQDDPRALGRAHGEAAARFTADFLQPAAIEEPLLFCPTDYAGVERTPYRVGLAETLPEDALVLWTGPDIVTGSVTAGDIVRARASYGRDLVLWDNFPVNDFDRTRLFLGPLTGRESAAGLIGIAANPMVGAAPSLFALSSIAEWAADPAAYSEREAAARAFRRVAPAADGLVALVEACSSWPPSAPRWPALTDVIGAGDLGRAQVMLHRLAATTADGAPPDLAEQLEPWVRGARGRHRWGARGGGVGGGRRCDVESADGRPTRPGERVRRRRPRRRPRPRGSCVARTGRFELTSLGSLPHFRRKRMRPTRSSG